MDYSNNNNNSVINHIYRENILLLFQLAIVVGFSTSTIW
jgi:hypothetical protein